MKLDSVNGHIIISLALLIASVGAIQFGVAAASDIPIAVAGIAIARLTSALDKANDKR